MDVSNLLLLTKSSVRCICMRSSCSFLIYHHQPPPLHIISTSVMAMPTTSSYLLLCLLWVIASLGVDGRCLEHQKSLLIQFNQSVMPFFHLERLSKWDSSRDCCDWPGVACCNNGYVTGLDLNNEGIFLQLSSSSPLFDLRYLTSLDLAGSRNQFQLEKATSSGFERLVNLTHLGLAFNGRFPVEVSNLTRLVSLELSCGYVLNDASDNTPSLGMLVGNLSRLLELRLDNVNLGVQGSEWSQVVSSSLPHLQVLSLTYCSLSGPIHASFQNLTSLSIIDLSGTNFFFPFPNIFSAFRTLTSLRLADCGFSGRIPESLGELKMLSELDVSHCNLEGSLPISFTKLTSLTSIDLSSNRLSGSIPSFSMFKNLTVLKLGGNRLKGSLLTTNWSELSGMEMLDLASNNLSGTFQIDMLQPWKNLTYLDLSYNNLSIDVSEVSLAFPRLEILRLVSCRLKAFPKLVVSNSSNELLKTLDLSANQIPGSIPYWTRNVRYLDLSHNQLEAFATPLQNYQAAHIDLSSNKLQGNIPSMPFAIYVDFSRNLLDSSSTQSLNISSGFFSVANNYLRGRIPESMCHVASDILDMSNNFLNGELPPCLMQQMKTLTILNLMNNTISGFIPDSFPSDCSLFYLNLNENSLGGVIPRSLERCRGMRVLDFGNNKLHDVFPCWMGSSTSNLKVVVLKSNLFYGNILCSHVKANWSSLQIMDISSNHFNGSLPSQELLEWKAMMINEESKFQPRNLPDYISSNSVIVELTVKGTTLVIERILTSLKLMDFSANAFEGPIPVELGYFKALRSLNISHNGLTGQMPSSLGNMQYMESLDLQNNKLSGRIPAALSRLTSLSVLNLSFNQLEGVIPNGRQFQTFTEYSFLHNKGLCGFPLTTGCGEGDEVVIPIGKSSPKIERGVWISAEVGYAVGLGFIIMPLIFWPTWRRRFYEFTDKIILKITCQRMSHN